MKPAINEKIPIFKPLKTKCSHKMWVLFLFLVSAHLTITEAGRTVTNFRSTCSYRGWRSDCRNRKLESVPKDVFTLHTSPYLSKNPYNCDCGMVWFLKKMSSNSWGKLIRDFKAMTCDKPDHLKGRKIYKLTEADVCPRGGGACYGGYIQKNSTCEDIDECQDGTAGCHKNAECENTPGSYLCHCKNGYHTRNRISCVGKAGLGCSSDANLCTGYAEECIDHLNLGEYVCQCKYGFERKSGVCKDTNECTSLNRPCGRGAKCLNTIGSYKCVCPKGYWYSLDYYRKCLDTDDCAFGENDCHGDAVCVNTVGNYSCKCKVGFQDVNNGRLCLAEKEEKFHIILIIVGCAILVVLVIAVIAFILYRRKNSNKKKVIEKKPLVKGKPRKNWLSTFMFPDANINRLPPGDSAITVWSDSD